MKTTKAQRERLAAMWAKATPRPWSWWTSCSYNRLTSDATLQDGGVLRGVTYKDGQTGIEGPVDDMALIVAAVNALPALLDDLDEAVNFADVPNSLPFRNFSRRMDGMILCELFAVSGEHQPYFSGKAATPQEALDLALGDFRAYLAKREA